MHACHFCRTCFCQFIKIWGSLHYNIEKIISLDITDHQLPFKAIFEHFGISSLGYKSILSKKNCCFCQILPFLSMWIPNFGHFNHLNFMKKYFYEVHHFFHQFWWGKSLKNWKNMELNGTFFKISLNEPQNDPNRPYGLKRPTLDHKNYLFGLLG